MSIHDYKTISFSDFVDNIDKYITLEFKNKDVEVTLNEDYYYSPIHNNFVLDYIMCKYNSHSCVIVNYKEYEDY